MLPLARSASVVAALLACGVVSAGDPLPVPDSFAFWLEPALVTINQGERSH